MIKRGQLKGNAETAPNPVIITGFLTQATEDPWPVTFTSLLDQITGVTFERAGVGSISAVKEGGFPEGLTLPNAQGEIWQDAATGNCYQARWVDEDTIMLYSATSDDVDGSGNLVNLADGLFNNRFIQICVFNEV